MRINSISFALALLCTSSAYALKPTSEPVFLSAAELGYDRKASLVVALGSVKVVQGETILLADRLSYDQQTNQVKASGNVALRQPSGDVLFADSVELQDNLERGLIAEFRAKLADDSLFAAREARRENKDVIAMDYAVYSPCKLCEKTNDPLWQVKAEKVVLDNAEQTVSYENAHMEFWGVPVAYTPYFRHATPDADAKSGILTPEAGADSELGAFAKLPVYMSIAPNADITLTPWLLSKEAPVIAGEYRHLFEDGYMQWRGSLTNPEKRDSLGNRTSGREIRGHIDALGNFALTEEWDWGFHIRRTTDDTYMRRYDINNDDTLTSRLYVERIKDRSYSSIQGLSFQGLTAEDNSDTTPLIMPLGEYSWQSAPGWMNSRFLIDAGAMWLTRKEGTRSQRLSLNTAWELPYTTPGGHVLTAKASVRGDIYEVDDVTRNSQLYDGSPARVIPQLELGWSYPLINHYAPGRSLLIEPIAEFIVSPKGTNSSKIPNEDSLIPEFNDSNLFEPNRFAGYDRLETGPRFNFGFQGLWQFADTTQMDFLFGQHYRTDQDNPFPFNNEVTKELSDYVGRVAVQWDTHLSAAYRFRLDRNDLTPQRNEVNMTFNMEPLYLRADYLHLNDDPFLADREEVVANSSLALTNYWSIFAGTRRDLKQNQQTEANAGFRYQDECFKLYGNFSRSLIRDRDVEPSTSFVLRVELENLN